MRQIVDFIIKAAISFIDSDSILPIILIFVSRI